MFGYAGRILDVDLGSEKVEVHPLDGALASTFLGGRGAGIKLLYDNLKQGINPLSSDNIIIFMTGPLVGTIFPCANRLVVTTKSPLTGFYGMSLAGGALGPELKYAGYDGLIVRGEAKQPAYIKIDDGKVEIEKADHLWGKTTSETKETIQKDIGGEFKTISIGPAGENLVKYAAIITSDRRAAGRCGVGTVMGSKKLKAIAIRGSGNVRVKDEKDFLELSSSLSIEINGSPALRSLKDYGTPSTINLVNTIGVFPTRNFQTGVFEGAKLIDGDALKWHKAKDSACFACPLACSKISYLANPWRGWRTTEGPEYETLYSFGSNCGNSDLRSIIIADRLCDELGLDSISTGCSIAFAMECFERGLLSKDEVDGLELEFGNSAAIIELVEKIANRQGFGDFLAEGVRRMSVAIGKGSEKFAMHVKGLELGGYDPRGLKGEGLSMATSERGGCHHAGGYIVLAEGHGQVDRFTTKGKGRLVRDIRTRTVLMDSATLCTFVNRMMSLEVVSKALTYSTGMAFSVSSLEEIGRRIIDAERIFNVREGMRRADDALPPRLIEEPMPEGPSKGQAVELDEMLDDFYEACGWDKKLGAPARQSI
jgi:aldehyde:ferredoxin oxidoreductase